MAAAERRQSVERGRAMVNCPPALCSPPHWSTVEYDSDDSDDDQGDSLS